jgi:hypothetical protein
VSLSLLGDGLNFDSIAADKALTGAAKDLAKSGSKMGERFYSGHEDGISAREAGESRQLAPRFDLDPEQRHSFWWEKEDAEGNRLAIALLSDALDDDKVATDLAEAFTARVVLMLPERWTMSRTRVLSFVDIILRESLDRRNSSPRLARTTLAGADEFRAA